MNTGLNLSADLGFYALAAILIAGMIAFGNRTYRKEYLARWSVAFLFIGLANVVSFMLVRRAWDETVSPWAAIVSGLVAGALLWSMFRGGFEMAVRRPPTGPMSRALLAVATLFGAALAVAIWSTQELVWRRLVAMDGAVVGSAALLSALLLIWERRRRLAPGFLVCGASLTLMGTAFLVSAFQVTTAAPESWVFPMVMFSMVLSGCSVLLFAVEDDRQAALLAATQIEHIAYYDPLTGLPNRSLFLDRLISLTSMPNDTEKAAILFVDIDHFKRVNDTYGHSVGDVVLKAVAARIRDTLRASDMAARYAGDEFVILIDDLTNGADVNRVAGKILAALEGPILTGGREIRVSGTIGISLYPTHGNTAEELIRSADAAMYRAKQEGRNRFGTFVPGHDDVPVRPEAELEAALRRAIDDEQLSVLYQPIVSLTDTTVRGVETFVRWQDDELGTVPPSEFIPVAESSSLIRPLGELVLHMVCRDAAEWLEEVENCTIFVSVNLSPEQFADPELVPRTRSAINRWNLDPGVLRFEIAESTIMADLRRSGRVLEAIRDIGVRVAVDHFGVGQTSLSHLARFPIEMLKLDRALITGELGTRRYGIFGAAAAIAQRLGKTVTVEGVETSNQRDLAIREGCEMGQGYFFGAPTTADAIRELISPEAAARPKKAQQENLDSEITLISRKAAKPGKTEGKVPRAVTLVADDDERMRNLMAILLRRTGHDVMTAEDGETLLSLLEGMPDEQVQLIVLDLMMPRMSGWEVLNHLSESSPDLLGRILLITAAGRHEIAKIDPKLYGGVLEKPFDQAVFYEAAARCVHRDEGPSGSSDQSDGPYAVH